MIHLAYHPNSVKLKGCGLLQEKYFNCENHQCTFTNKPSLLLIH